MDHLIGVHYELVGKYETLMTIYCIGIIFASIFFFNNMHYVINIYSPNAEEDFILATLFSKTNGNHSYYIDYALWDELVF